jgi:CDP-diacylglycerol--serine O-phosphatidyltransferase
VTTGPWQPLQPSNLLTYGSIAAGLAAVAAAERGAAGTTAALLALAVVADTFDGRFAARFVRSAEEKRLGVELDSLADAVTFGAAPVMCASLLKGPSTPGEDVLWWAAALVYVACAVTRLSFYNVSHGNISGFVGLPSPVAALLWASSMLFGLTPATAAITGALAGLAMIAPVRVPRPTGVGLALFVTWPIAVGLIAWLR